MDVLNFISWVKGSRIVTSVEAAQTLIPVGLRDPKRDDGYLAGAISVEDLIGGSDTFTNENVQFGNDSYKNGDISNKYYNTAIGWNSANNEGGFQQYYNVFVGYNSGLNFQSGSGNVFVGDATANGGNNANGNVGIGQGSCVTINNSSANIGIGSNCLYSINSSNTNIAVGQQALFFTYNCSRNIGIGQNALYDVNGSFENIAIGTSSMSIVSSTTYGNVSIGYTSGRYMTNAQSNVFIGNQPASNNWITGDHNIGIGTGALVNITSGYNNIVLGQYALQNSTSGYNNIALGSYSGSGLTTGAENIFIGNDTSCTGSGFTRSVAIGKNAVIDSSNQLSIGSTAYPLGTVTTESLSSTKTWTVKINGTVQKILLA